MGAAQSVSHCPPVKELTQHGSSAHYSNVMEIHVSPFPTGYFGITPGVSREEGRALGKGPGGCSFLELTEWDSALETDFERLRRRPDLASNHIGTFSIQDSIGNIFVVTDMTGPIKIYYASMIKCSDGCYKDYAGSIVVVNTTGEENETDQSGEGEGWGLGMIWDAILPSEEKPQTTVRFLTVDEDGNKVQKETSDYTISIVPFSLSSIT